MDRTLAYRKDIDALRGVSIILVVMYHAFPHFLPSGFIGVDIFFVISGFLITSIILKELNHKRFSFPSFYKRRIRRIFPALIVVLFSTIVIGWFILFIDEYESLGRHILYSTFFVQNFNLINELGYFDTESHYKPLLHLWTLSIEEQYYLVWPLVLFFLFKFKIDVIKILLAIIVISFLSNVYLINWDNDKIFFHSITRIWEIGIGSLLATLNFQSKHLDRLAKKSVISPTVIFGTGLLMIVSASYFIKPGSLYPSWMGLMPVIGATLIIKANITNQNWFGLDKVGLISYSLYLWHWVIISFLYIYIGDKPNSMFMLLAIALSVLLSCLTTYYIERIRYTHSNTVVFMLATTLFSFGAMGFVIQNSNGAPDRPHLSYLEKFNIEFERTPAIDESCEAYVTKLSNEDRLFDYCRSHFIDKTGEMVALIGDSHAHMLFPGIAHEAAKYNYSTVLFANSSCPPFKGFEWGGNSNQISECQRKIEQILEIVKRELRISKLIITTRGPVYIHGEVQGNFSVETVTESLNHFVAPQRLTYEKLANGYKDTLTILTDIPHIKHISYLLENPELDFSPKKIVPRPFDYFDISVQTRQVKYDLYSLRMAQYKDTITKISGQFKQIQVIDLADYFCDEVQCKIYDNGNFLYADNDHLSVFGATYFTQKAQKILFLDLPTQAN